VQCFLPDANSSAVDSSVFDRVWKQYLTVPLFLIVVLFPLINFKSPTFFTKLNSLGRFSVLFIVLFRLTPDGIPLTVKHILVECANLRDIREKYFTVSSLTDLFDRLDNHSVIDFIKETHFYHQL